MQDVFPNLPSDVIMADLRLTRSVEITIENIIEGRLYAPSVSRPNVRRRCQFRAQWVLVTCLELDTGKLA